MKVSECKVVGNVKPTKTKQVSPEMVAKLEQAKTLVTLRRIAQNYVWANSEAVAGHHVASGIYGARYSVAVEDVLSQLRKLPANHKLYLRYAWEYSRKVPYSERQDCFHTFYAGLRERRSTIEQARWDCREIWVDWYRYSQRRRAISLNSPINEDSETELLDTIHSRWVYDPDTQQAEIADIVQSWPKWARYAVLDSLEGKCDKHSLSMLRNWAIENLPVEQTENGYQFTRELT